MFQMVNESQSTACQLSMQCLTVDNAALHCIVYSCDGSLTCTDIVPVWVIGSHLSEGTCLHEVYPARELEL